MAGLFIAENGPDHEGDRRQPGTAVPEAKYLVATFAAHIEVKHDAVRECRFTTKALFEKAACGEDTGSRFDVGYSDLAGRFCRQLQVFGFIFNNKQALN